MCSTCRSESIPDHPGVRRSGREGPSTCSSAWLVVALRCAIAIGALAGAPASVHAQEGDLARCLAVVRQSPQARRVRAETWERYTSSLATDPRIVQEQGAQPEFRLPIWDYLAVMVDDERIADGLRFMGEHQATFDSVTRRYRVAPHVLAAIWGIESDFGRGMGGYDVLRSLATLSCHGRRQRYFRRELLAALRIVQRGDVDGAHFRGSWAGAFGQVQFMPGTFEWLAQDFDGDGRRDILHSTGDALASAANYLRNARWRDGGTWGIEVRLPPSLATRGEGRRVKRPLSVWAARGVQRVDGTPLVAGDLAPATPAGLHLPAGPRGPAFLTMGNFDAVYRYNASEAYTLAIVHLADRLQGAGPFVTPWPTDDPGLSRAERRELQRLLATRGHDVGTPSGVLTTRTRAAVRAEQERLGHPPTGRPGQRLLEALRLP